jgi:hypothetical protein
MHPETRTTQDTRTTRATRSTEAAVDLSWIPLGAGGHSVRFNGIVYERIVARRQHRPPENIVHSALEVRLDGARSTIEMTPVPDGRGRARGVVAEGPVGLRVAGRLRIFRYEVRRWRDGVVPDLAYALTPPVRLTDDPATARRVLDLLPTVPTLVWGRDELRTGDMWSCNSIISWVLTAAGIDTASIARPARCRAPGWEAGIAVAHRRSTGADRAAGA